MVLESELLAKSFSFYPKISLDSPSELLAKVQSTFPILRSFLETKDQNSFYSTEPFESLENFFSRPVPLEGVPWEEIVQFFTKEIVPRFNTNASTKFLAYVPGDPAPAALAGAMIMPVFNQFVGSTLASPGGVAIESLALQWIKELMGYPETSGACFTSGGSIANLTCLYSGLNAKVPWLKDEGLFGHRSPIVYCSDQTHNSINKALLMFGLGHKNIRIVSSDDNFRINTDELYTQILEDTNTKDFLPVLIIANAGTTNTGAIDDIDHLLAISKEFNLWLHVDGAYGALSRITDTKASVLLKYLPEADSIALDAHKWMFIPYEAGISLVKDRKKLKEAFSLTADYLAESHAIEETNLMVNFWEYSPQLTREFRGLKLWFFFMSYGLNGLETFITKNIHLAKYLTARIKEDDRFELMSTSELSIVCFRWKGTDEFNDTLISKIQQNQNYYISKTTLKGSIAIRVCIVNLTSDISIIDGLLKEIELIAGQM